LCVGRLCPGKYRSQCVLIISMEQLLKQRVLVARAAIVGMSACGMLAGYLLGCALALRLSQNWLDQNSRLMAVQEDASSIEARSLLAILKDSPYPACSDAEIAYFREMVFRSAYLKDAGRIHGGKIDCSATVGHPARPIGQFNPESTQRDGTIAYSNLLPLRDSSMKRPGLQLGSTYVVFGSQVPANLGPIPMHLSFTMKDTATRPAGAPVVAAQDKGPDLTTDGTTRVGDTLYATRCSALHFNCVTASASVAEALHGEGSTVTGCMLLGGVAGALLGMAFSLMYRRSRNMEQQLRRAIAHDKLQVAYQPIVSLASGRIVGAEALVRWTDEEGQEVGPEVFVKIAEEHGFVGSITRLVVQRALNAFAETLRNRNDFRLSVNVAAADLADPGFLPMLDDAIKRAKVQSKSLVIEITESSTANREVAMETIRALRRRGHSIHIDDFGTGYSSLSYLLYLSVDTIKIDKAFTRAIGTESVTVAILPQILAMAESLKLEVVVEGVETGQQADYFSTAGQPVYGQGWLYGHPVTAEEFHGLLADDWSKSLVPPDTAATRAGRTDPLRIDRCRIA
jgi:sensor c-di-GMP phosphodiesterase-like protein